MLLLEAGTLVANLIDAVIETFTVLPPFPSNFFLCGAFFEVTNGPETFAFLR